MSATIVRAFSHAGIWDNLSFAGLLTADGSTRFELELDCPAKSRLSVDLDRIGYFGCLHLGSPHRRDVGDERAKPVDQAQNLHVGENPPAIQMYIRVSKRFRER